MQSPILVGTDKAADLQIEGPNCYPQHAEIQRGKGRITCTALIGDEEDLLADTYTWLDGNQLRTGQWHHLQGTRKALALCVFHITL